MALLPGPKVRLSSVVVSPGPDEAVACPRSRHTGPTERVFRPSSSPGAVRMLNTEQHKS
jgi:hypothetical protein